MNSRAWLFRLAVLLLCGLFSPGLAWASHTSLPAFNTAALDTPVLPGLPSALEAAPREEREIEDCGAFCAEAPRLELKPLPLLGRAHDPWRIFSLATKESISLSCEDGGDVPLGRGLFGGKGALGICKYGANRPTYFVDPTGHAVFEAEALHDKHLYEELRGYDVQKNVVRLERADRQGWPTLVEQTPSTALLSLVRQYGSPEAAINRLHELEAEAFKKYAVTITEPKDYVNGHLNEDKVYKQFLERVGGFAGDVSGLREGFLASIAGAQAGESRDISVAYNVGYDYSAARAYQVAGESASRIPLARGWQIEGTLIGLGREGLAPKGFAGEHAAWLALDTALTAGTGVSIYRAGAGLLRAGAGEAALPSAASYKNPLNLSTAGRTPQEAAAMRDYAQRTNQWLEQQGSQVIQPTKGALRREASAAARQERLRAARAGQPYQGHAGHVPDTAISGQAQPPAGWLDMPGRSNPAAGGVLGSRVGKSVDVILVDGKKP